tara:strand:+ start:3760 stop:4182 length:423 start_codon:yes stop_codon:yes gene_type:complete
MSESLEAITLMRRFAAADHPPGSDAALIASRFQTYLDSAGALSLGEVFSVAPRKGQWPWWRIEKRDRVIAAAQKLVAAVGDPESALQHLSRFAHGRGRHAKIPAHSEDSICEAAREFLDATNGQVPGSPRTLARAAACDN